MNIAWPDPASKWAHFSIDLDRILLISSYQIGLTQPLSFPRSPFSLAFSFFMDCNCWSSSGIEALGRCSGYYSLQKGDDRAVSISVLAVGSRTSRWRLLWRKLMREKKKIFDCTSPVQLPYDPFTYSQNFEDRGSMRFDDLDSITRSFSARFAVPARVFAKDE